MPNIKNFKTIIKPIITEKSSLGSENNQVTFHVEKNSTKDQIKTAVEQIFKVRVKKVNTSIVKGKLKSFRGSVGKRSDYKKAFVSLDEGQSIDLSSGV